MRRAAEMTSRVRLLQTISCQPTDDPADRIGFIILAGTAGSLRRVARSCRETADWEGARLVDRECLNLNAATNVQNPYAAALAASGIGSRPSLGHPGEKYEMGLGPVQRLVRLVPAPRAPEFRTGLRDEESQIDRSVEAMDRLAQQALRGGVTARSISPDQA